MFCRWASLFMNASNRPRMLPPAPTFSPATLQDTNVSLEPRETVWKIRPALAICWLCSFAILRSRHLGSRLTAPRLLRAVFIHPSMSRRGVQVACALGATAPSSTERARVSPKTLMVLTRPRLIAAPPCRGRPLGRLCPEHRHQVTPLERKLVKDD